MNSKNEIKTATGLEDQYHSFMELPVTDSQKNIAGEYVKIFKMSEWVLIAFIRFNEDKDAISLEVEVSLPIHVCGNTLNNYSDQMNLLQDMMLHIIYVKKLLKMGFTLSIIKEDCLWIASYHPQVKPSLEFFEAIIPPKVN